MTMFQDVPVELVEVIISYCDLAAFLQLRLVSSSMKILVDTSSQFKQVLENVQISLHSSTLEEFMETAPSLPLCNFYITDMWKFRLHRSCFYGDTLHLRNFIKSFCPGIRKLRVSEMYCCTLDTELEFFQSLQNLRYLHIDWLMYSEIDLRLESPRAPFIGKNQLMKQLVVDCEDDSGEYLVKLIKSCPSLEVIKIPSSWSDKVGFEAYDVKLSANYGEEGEYCYPYILRLGAEGHLKHLRTLDLNQLSFKMDLCSEIDLRFFQELMANPKIWLQNVPPSFVSEVRNVVPGTLDHLRERIVSFQGIPCDVKGFVNLEVLNFTSNWDLEGDYNLGTNQLPALKTIFALIDERSRSNRNDQEEIFECIFRPNDPRTSVTQLDINIFPHPTIKLGFQAAYLDLSFPNITRLSLEIYEYVSRNEVDQFVEVITRKVLLEQLTLSVPLDVPEAALLRKTPEGTYTFLRLRNLRKLKLVWRWCQYVQKEKRVRTGGGILRMIGTMSLTHLEVGSKHWEDVTREGITGLTEGPLGQSILRIRLEFTFREETDLLEYEGCLEMLEKVSHRNRLAKGLTSISFEQLMASKKESIWFFPVCGGPKKSFRKRWYELVQANSGRETNSDGLRIYF